MPMCEKCDRPIAGRVVRHPCGVTMCQSCASGFEVDERFVGSNVVAFVPKGVLR